MKKYLIAICLVGLTFAAPRADRPSHSPDKLGSIYEETSLKGGDLDDDLPPQPYSFQYGVSDQYTGTNYKAVETQDDKGTVLGSYVVNLPDGRTQTVTYHADSYGGFVADVKYKGEAQFPPEPAEGYGNTYKLRKTQQSSYSNPEQSN
ncbi:unnamed protein product [Lepeophtheirus salmonis]|nr:unnamed protein product [Lepeophtheirus salmonis]CAF2890399.1 unnamed protein product [Lepeophtheirus salmonis]